MKIKKELRMEEETLGAKGQCQTQLILHFIFAVCVISFSLSWSSVEEIFPFTCHAGEGAGFVVQVINPVNLQYLE